MESNSPIGQAILLPLADLRSPLDSNLYTLDSQQLDLWWRPLHCNWLWFRGNKDLFQYPVLPFCWTEHLP